MNIGDAHVRRWRVGFLPVVVALLGIGLSGASSASASPHRTAPSARTTTPPAAGSFVPLPPARLLDTRAGVAIPARGTTVLTVAGHGGVPTSGVASVALVMTAVRETANGYLTMYADGTDRPTVVSVNFSAGFARSNTVLSQLGTGGAVRIFNGALAPSNVTVDVSGYYTAGTATAAGAFVPVTPTRLLDTRGPGTKPEAGEGRIVAVTGQAGIPEHVAAVVANVGAFASTRSGHVVSGTLYEGVVSYFAAGQAVGNLMVIPVTSRDGTIEITNASAGFAHLYFDAVGYIVTGQPATAGLFGSTGSSPTALDTRVLSSHYKTTPVPAGQTVSAMVVGPSLNVPNGASAVAVQVTATDAKTSGYLTAYPTGSARPPSAALVFAPGRNISNTVLVPIGSDNKITFYNGAAGPVDVIAQVIGFVGAIAGPYTWTSPLTIIGGAGGRGSFGCASASFCLQEGWGEYVVWNGHEFSAPMDIGLGPESDAAAMSCPTDGVCVTVTGDAGFNRTTTSAIYHDGAWHAAPNLPAGAHHEYPVDLSCTSASFCVAVGTYTDQDGAAAWTFNGTTWTLVPIPLGDTAFRVSCGSPTLCMAVGGGGTAWYDGSTWRLTTSGMANPDYPSCVSATLCVVASFFHTQTFDRSVWGPLVSSNLSHSTEQRALSCASANYCVGLFDNGNGTGASVAIYDGTSWSGQSVMGYPESYALACPSTTFCAIGGGYVTIGTR